MARTVGFFTDTTLCIGCKACEVACKEWNQLPGHAARFGDGYDNTGQLDEQNWRYVQFHERSTPKGGVDSTPAGGNLSLIHNVGPNRVDIRNDSCSDYFLRLVVLLPPVAPSVDAGIPPLVDPGDAGTNDAEAGP